MMERRAINKHHHSYRADIDGLRAIAVLSVLFYHADLGFSGGYVGVDVFFVISGFLITKLILKDLDAGKFSIVEFWERRICRILPALAVVVFTCLAVCWFLFLPFDFKQLGQSVFAQAVLSPNIYYFIKSGYFDQAAEIKPLLHTWSLAVEEQFYLLFPFLLIALNWVSNRLRMSVTIIIAVLSFGLSIYCSYFHPSANFYLLPTRSWELLIGVFLALLPLQRISSKWLLEILSWTGVFAILLSVFLYDRETRFPGITAVLPCVGAGLMIWANGVGTTSIGSILATRPFVFVGLISYSLYLWHWPILVFARYCLTFNPPSVSHRILLLFLSVGLSVLSWKFVETPFRKRAILKTRAHIFTFAALSAVIMIISGLAIQKWKGFPSRVPEDVLRYAEGNKDTSYQKDVKIEDIKIGNVIELGKGDKDLPIDFIVWGDSMAMSTLPVFDSLCKDFNTRGVAITHTGTAPLVGYQSPWILSAKNGISYNQAVVEFIKSHNIQNVVLVAVWGAYANTDGFERIHLGLNDTISAFKDSETRIWIMRQVPKQRWNVPRALALSSWLNQDLDALCLPLVDHHVVLRNEAPIFEGLCSKYPFVTILDPTSLFITGNKCRIEKDGNALYYDDYHLTDTGAMLLRPLFEPIFQHRQKNKQQE